MINKSSDSGLPSVLKKLGAMTAIRDTSMVEQSLLRTLGPLLGILETAFYRVDDNNNIIRALYHSRKVVEDHGSKRIVDNIEEVTNEQHVSPELRNLFESVRLLRKSCCRKLGLDLLICYPIFGENQVLGYFVFRRDREVTPVEDAIIHGVLEVFTNYFALLDSSQRDQLTGLLNRYSLEANLDRLWNLLSAKLHSSDQNDNARVNQPETYWLCVLDVDHFKKINDTFGHMIGDEVLIMVTRLLQNSLRQSDLLYRYGGEEFVAIIAANDFESAKEAFARTRVSIEEFHFPQVGHVTISGGFSNADPSVLPQEVIHRADSALYAAKDAGRNRVFDYDTLVKQGILKAASAGSIDLF
ncbi:MAG: GGDEF domain-containing protein [Methylomonas sp.]|jgi:diguanylate cyclase (GGDEF)-like protein|uniref:GGDEF domain-containing protein n=1 Tax=Methylomonas sp. TaxID=418 RepID=UPI0025D4F4D2|nr:GGDEF domain-containing protein [Methylomonas sp.]MCK9606328.1 GGDEF domain-containing protein [Methylomonas sp.]